MSASSDDIGQQQRAGNTASKLASPSRGRKMNFLIATVKQNREE